MVSRSEKDAVLCELDEYGDPIHVYGQPGVGKTQLLEQIEDGLDSETLFIKASSRYDFSQLLEFTLLKLKEKQSSLEEAKKLVKKIRGLGVAAVGKVEIEDFNPTLLQETKNLIDEVDGELILFLDDIHLLSENSQELSDFLQELDEISGDLKIVSSGQVGLNQKIEQFLVNYFTLGETKNFFEERGYDLEEIDIEDIHDKTDGHPFMLHLLIESQEELTDVSLPEVEISEYVEDTFLESLEPEEEKFLKNVSPLVEFDSITCSRVLDKDETDTRRLLKELNKKQVIERAGHRFGGVSNYRIHSQLKELLYKRNQSSKEIHRKAFNYYSEKVIEEDKEEGTVIINSFLPVFMAEYHLKQIVNEKSPDKIYQEIENLELGQPGKSLFVIKYTSFFPTDKPRNQLIYDELGELVDYVKDKEELSEGRENLLIYSLNLARGSVGILLGDLDDAKPDIRKEAVEILEDTYIQVKEDEIELDIPVDEFDLEDSAVNDGERLFRHLIALTSCYLIQKNCRELNDVRREDEYREKFKENLSELGFSPDVWGHLKEEMVDFRDGVKNKLNLESRVDNLVNDILEEYQGEDFSRGFLMDLQEEMSQVSQNVENIFKTGSFFSHTGLEKDYFVVKAESIGNILERNENPIFAYIWLNFMEALFDEWGIMNERQKELFEDKLENIEEERKEFEEENDSITNVENIEVNYEEDEEEE